MLPIAMKSNKMHKGDKKGGRTFIFFRISLYKRDKEH